MQRTIVITGALLLLALTGCSDTGDAASGEEPPKERTVLYEVTSDSDTASNVTYMTLNDGEVGQEQATEAPLPFEMEIPIEDDGLFQSSVFSLTAQAAEGATEITCRITADGEVISEQTSTGQFAVVSCSGSAGD